MKIVIPVSLFINYEDYEKIDSKIFDSNEIFFKETEQKATYYGLGLYLEKRDEVELIVNVPTLIKPETILGDKFKG